MSESEDTKVTWVTCPECGVKIGIIVSVGRETALERPPMEPILSRSPDNYLERFESAGIDLSLVDVEETEDIFIIRPKRFLGDLWGPINDSVRNLGGGWVREGRESRWEIMKEVLQV